MTYIQQYIKKEMKNSFYSHTQIKFHTWENRKIKKISLCAQFNTKIYESKEQEEDFFLYLMNVYFIVLDVVELKNI